MSGITISAKSIQKRHKRGRQGGQSVHPNKSKTMKKISEKQAIDDLERRAMEYVPGGSKAFADLPISDATKRGLKKSSFIEMTDIQKKSLPISLKGKDVLGAAQTGSGKTLAFLIPTLEILYRRKWGPTDGLGALIISPTRELAVQIFDVLRSIGGFHAFSAGLVIGGKELKSERDRLSRMNILVATPGRLLQHMDQTVGFEPDNLQVLVLDEADRILDMGFSRTLSALLAHLPKTRQTLLFSATQTQSISDLARLSLKDPIHVGIQDSMLSSTSSAPTPTSGDAPPSATATVPQNIEQHYVICALDEKLDILWSFIKTHLASKILVFLSSCKQVRFVFETFCKMHPGMPLLHLHGKQKQSARLTMYSKFSTAKCAVLFATDIAARGLDFPSIDWVLQADAPEDGETYIHRVGRTARYDSKGRALLFLVPSEEEGMKKVLEKKGIKVEKIKIRPSKTHTIQNQLQKLAFEDPDIKYLGQRAFVSYLRSIYLHKNKFVFKLDELPIDKFAEALGLPGTPKVKFLSKEMVKNKKNASRNVEGPQAAPSGSGSKIGNDSSDEDEDVGLSSEEDEEQGARQPEKPKVRTKYDRMFERKNQKMEHQARLIDDSDEGGSSEDDFITLKRADHGLGDDASSDTDDNGDNTDSHKLENLSKRKLKMGRAKRAVAQGGLAKKLIFDDDGNPHEIYEFADADEWFEGKGGLGGVVEEGKKFAEGERDKMKVTNVVDKEEAREKRREKKRKRKEREMEAGQGQGATSSGAVVEDASVDDGYVSPEFDLPSSDSDEEDEPRRPPPKKSKASHSRGTLEDDEELALRLLSGR